MKNQIIALSTWEIPVLTYSFGIIGWTDTDFEGLDRLTRRLLYKIPFPPSKFIYNKIISTSERRMRIRKYPQITQNISKKNGEQGEPTEERLKRLAVQAYKGYTSFKLNEQIVEDDVTITQENLNIWGENPLHGKFPLYLQENRVDKESSLLWPSAGYIYPVTESLALAIQDSVIKTKNYEKHCWGVE